MSLTIRFLHELRDGPRVAIGQITLGDFVEEFEMVLTAWSRERYEQQWEQGIQRLVNGDPKSCLIASFWSSREAFGGEWWLLYRVEDQVAVQSQLIRPDIFDQNLESFDPSDPYASIPDRCSEGNDGARPSEWLVPFNQISPLPPLK